MVKAAIPTIQVTPGTYRDALWACLCANVGRAVPVDQLPGPVGRGSDPLYASKRLNMKLARANGEVEIRRVRIGDYEAYGLFPRDTTVKVTVPVLSPTHGGAFDPKTGRTR